MDKESFRWEEIDWENIDKQIEYDSFSEVDLETEVPSFQSFTVDAWVDYTNALLRLEVFPPDVFRTGDELHLVLIDVYRSQKSQLQRDRFAEAVARIFESTPPIPENAEQIYYLLQLISYLRPYYSKRLVRRHLVDGILRGVEYGNQDLNTMLLVAASKYDVDDELVDFIHRSAPENGDFRYLLVCLRVLSTRSGAETFSFLNMVVPRIISNIEAAQVSRQLKGLIKRTGYASLWRWFTINATDLRLQYPCQFILFEQGLRERFLPWEKAFSAENDAYTSLLSAEVNAATSRFSPDEVLGLAKLSDRVGEEFVFSTFEYIWKRSLAADKRPWRFHSASQIPGTKNKNKGTILIGSDCKDFDIELEPQAADIFERIKDRFGDFLRLAQSA